MTPFHLSSTCRTLLQYERSGSVLPQQPGAAPPRRERRYRDPRALRNDYGRLPYHVAMRKGYSWMAEVLDPSMPVRFLLAGQELDASSAYGPPRLAVLAAATLHTKLLADIEALRMCLAEAHAPAAGRPDTVPDARPQANSVVFADVACAVSCSSTSGSSSALLPHGVALTASPARSGWSWVGASSIRRSFTAGADRLRRVSSSSSSIAGDGTMGAGRLPSLSLAAVRVSLELAGGPVRSSQDGAGVLPQMQDDQSVSLPQAQQVLQHNLLACLSRALSGSQVNKPLVSAGLDTPSAGGAELDCGCSAADSGAAGPCGDDHAVVRSQGIVPLSTSTSEGKRGQEPTAGSVASPLLRWQSEPCPGSRRRWCRDGGDVSSACGAAPAFISGGSCSCRCMDEKVPPNPELMMEGIGGYPCL
jgi:hypothetical protein